MVLCNKLTVSSWNAHGLFYRLNNERHSKLKDPDIVKYLNSDIIGIVETKACETDNIYLQGYSLISKTNRPRLSKGIYGGVAVFCKVGISKGITPLPVTHSEYIWVKLKKSFFNFEKDIYICFIYNSPKNSSYSKDRGNEPTVLELLEKDMASFQSSGETVLMGDFNAHISTRDKDYIDDDSFMPDILPASYVFDSVVKNRNTIKPSEKTDEYGKSLLELCIASQSRILNGRTLGDTIGKCTSFQYNGASTVDYCVVSCLLLNHVRYFKVSDLTPHSDHSQITACFALKHIEKKFKTDRPVPNSIKWNAIISRKYAETLQSTQICTEIDRYLGDTSLMTDTESATAKLSNIYNNVGTIIGAIRPRITLKTKKKKNKAWFDRDCSALKRSVRDLARRISNRQANNELIKHYYNEKKRYKTLIRKKHRQYKAKILNDLVDLEKLNPKEFWNLIDKFKNEGGAPSEKSGNISPEDWSSYFKRLLNSNKVDCTLDDSEFLHFSSTNIPDHQIKMCEVQAAMKTLKNNTSSGLDRISNEMLKQSTPRLQECLCKLFNIILNNEKYPSQWRENLLKPIHKKGNDTDPKNYRGIVISSCLSKLFSKILHNRIEKHINDNNIMNENQTGFRKQYRTSDHILTLRSIIEKLFKKNSYLFTCFVDFEKAFDTVWRDALFKKLKHMGIHGKILSILENMYSEVNYAIKLPYGLTDSVSSSTGLKQGCVLSPLLFNLYVNDLPSCFSRNHDPVIIGKYVTNVLMYADDLVLMSLSKEGLQKCLDDLHSYCKKWKLKVNTDKTKILIFNKSGRLMKKHCFIFESEELEIVQEFKYLGIVIKASGIFTKGISELSNKALKVLFMIRKKFQSSFIFPTLQCRLFDTCVKPILLYCTEIWSPYSLNFVKVASKSNSFNLEESYEDFLPERIHTKFCKFLLGVNKYSSNLACKSEVGRYPLAISASLLSLKYWLHINDVKNPKACDKFIYQTLLNGDEIKSSFGDHIKNLLRVIGFEHVWQNKGTFSKRKLINAVERKLIERYNSFFKEAINGRITVKGRTLDKLRTFKTFKNNYKLENYLCMKVDKHLIFNLAKLRISNHQLEIETGRYQKKVIDQRLCKVCNQNGMVEDEFHFLLTCKAYQAERNEFFTEINAIIVPFESYTSQEQFLFLMSTNDTEVIMLLIYFIEKCLQIRQSSGRQLSCMI